MLKHYVLIGQTPVIEPDLLKWAMAFGCFDNQVARTEIGAGVVSTIFLGLDHNWFGGPPLLFETMVFVDEKAVFQKRCSTWMEAEAQHKRVVEEWREQCSLKK